jgi:2-methylcitrate dehydratase
VDSTIDQIPDVVSECIADHVVAQRQQQVRPGACREAKRRILDSIGCAVAAMDSQPATIARGLAADTTSVRGASVVGLGTASSMELAAFANAVMVRYLDCNDTYFTARGGGGHPSDVISTAWAVGEAVGASGSDIIRAVILGYEVNGALASAVWLRERGWDQGLNVVAATAMMAGDLLGLGKDQLRHALALAVTPHIPVRQNRIGRLSMWKGSATAGAARNGIFAALLADRGMTGPAQPYVGRSGLWELVTGEFDLVLPLAREGSIIEDTAIKLRPAEFNAQAALDLVVDLREVVSVDSIESIDVQTYHLAYHEIGMDRAKWDPQNRETADHSLPYLMAVALVDGYIDTESCAPDRVTDPSLRPLLNKITISERPEYTERFPAEFNVEITVTLRDGSTVVRHATHPHGHPRNPASDAEVEDKFRRLTATRGHAEQAICEEVRHAVAALDTAPDIRAVMKPLTQLVPRVPVDESGGIGV